MTTDKPDKTVEVGHDLNGLRIRRSLCQLCVKTIDNMPEGTEGKESAVEEYKRQLAVIDAKIAEITGTPPPVVVGLKTARLFGKSELSQGE